MTDGLDQIGTAAIEQLQELKEQHGIFEDRLRQLERKKNGVSQEVFDKIKADYEARRDELDRESRPLKQEARAEYSKLKRIHQTIVEDHEKSTLDREEVELRHDLGEYDDGECETRLEYLDTTLKDQEEQLKSAEKLKDRFVTAFGSMEELESSTAAYIEGEAEPSESDDSAPETTADLPAPPPIAEDSDEDDR